jgi:hypothetical protein
MCQSREKHILQAMMAEGDQASKCRGDLSIDWDGGQQEK